jgi:hypothetical protein
MVFRARFVFVEAVCFVTACLVAVCLVGPDEAAVWALATPGFFAGAAATGVPDDMANDNANAVLNATRRITPPLLLF